MKWNDSVENGTESEEGRMRGERRDGSGLRGLPHRIEWLCKSNSSGLRSVPSPPKHPAACCNLPEYQLGLVVTGGS